MFNEVHNVNAIKGHEMDWQWWTVASCVIVLLFCCICGACIIEWFRSRHHDGHPRVAGQMSPIRNEEDRTSFIDDILNIP
jgi:hypothetical protein